MKLILTICVVLVMAAQTLAERDTLYKGQRVYKLHPVSKIQLEYLRLLYLGHSLKVDFWSHPRHVEHDVFVRVEPSVISRFEGDLRTFHIKNSVLMKDLDKEVEDNFGQNDRAKKKSLGEPFAYFMTYTEMMAWLKDKATDCGDERCQLFSIGKTYEGKDMMVMKITDGYEDENKPGLWIDGGIHAREWIAYATACYLIDKFIDDQSGDNILMEYNVYILPAVNADGYVYSMEKDRLWRKNRQPNVNSTCIGTDINRNFGFMWNSGGHVDDNPCGPTWPGTKAYTTPEAKNIAEWMSSHIPSGGWEVYLTLHSFGNKWMSCWGYTYEQPENFEELKRVGMTGVNATNRRHQTGWKFGNAADILYPSSGTSRDWACGTMNIPYVYTLELRDLGRYGSLLPPSQIVPQGEEIWEGIKAMMDAISEGKP